MKNNLVTTYLKQLREGSLVKLSLLFGEYAQVPPNFGEPQRKRLFTPSRTLWLFLTQIINHNCSCRDIVRSFLSVLAMNRGETASCNTAAYCKARARLKLQDIQTVHKRVIKNINIKAGQQFFFHGRPVKVVDGSSVSMPDTPENQEAYPQPHGQKEGCGFPVMRLVALFCLKTGTLLSVAYDSLNISEIGLFRRLWDLFEPHDIVVADRYFCSYVNLALLKKRGVDSVMRLHQKRKAGKNIVRTVAKNDHIVLWKKPPKRPQNVGAEEWESIPDEIQVREITTTRAVKGFRTKVMTVVTTLLDDTLFKAEDFAELYERRWCAELYLRDIKISMGMDILKCKTPAMIEKELWLFIIAHNLVRAIMIEASVMMHKPLERISFKGTMSTVVHFTEMLSQTVDSPDQHCPYYQLMLTYITKDTLPNRPGRREPRALKRRGKNYQLLTGKRDTFEETQHRHKHRKKAA